MSKPKTKIGSSFVRPWLIEALAAGERPARVKGGVRLDAAEAASAPTVSGFDTGDLNRFPDAEPTALAARMAEVYGVAPECLAVVEGVAAASDLIVRLFRRPEGREAVIVAPGTISGGGFSSSAASAASSALLHGARLVDLATDMRAGFDIDALKAEISGAVGDAVVFLASPTYATGEALDQTALLSLIDEAPTALFVIDESFVEFAGGESLASAAAERENLIVLRSLSRAYGLAGAPCGAAIASAGLADILRRAAALRPLPRATATLALAALAPMQAPLIERRIAQTAAERGRIAEALAQSPHVDKVLPGAANFVALEIKDADALARRLAERGVRIDFDDSAAPVVARVTVGTPTENDLALAAFGVEPKGRPARIAEIARDTKETKIAARVNLDGAPGACVSTGIGYFDHMLEQIAKHGGFELTLTCKGDVHVDAHHTIEDCMLALGGLLKEALGEKKGIQRFGFTLPMDETEAEALIDLSGRPYAVFEGEFAATHLGDYPTEMTAHAFRSLAETLGAAIHVKTKGENDHHKTEACFKAFGRALREAIRVEGEDLPSTKGVL
ncbi:MAG: imidazoleglycerol-phosphate dehydratase HisB [Maricaulaceae bacterium]|jgi:histidinol-phosphate aminotransferase/imidazoleglycerol-phosphate dehydratase/histidinol-phosphatase